MIEIDGSLGGGQMLRTALGLSAVTNKPFKIFNIRKTRNHSGIKEQHLQAIIATKQLCDAEVKGASLNSSELIFTPKKIKSGNLLINIKTAGSVGLVLQSLLIPAIKTDLKIKIKGGATYGKWALPIDHMQNVLIPLLEKMNYKANIKIIKEGFYPKGGSIIEIHSYKADLKPLTILEKGDLISINGISKASLSLKNKQVAERQAKEAKKILFDHFKIPVKIIISYVDTICPGSGIQLWITTTNSVIGANSLGELGKKSEIVAKEAVEKLIFEYENGAVDCYTADQLIPYLALAKKSKILTSKITDHIKTNAFVVEQFLPVKFKIENNIIECN